MTYSIKNIAGGVAVLKKKPIPQGFFGTTKPLFGENWIDKKLWRSCIEKGRLAKEYWTLNDIYTYVWGAHAGHALEFLVACVCYVLLYWDGSWMEEAKEWRAGWVAKIVLFNLLCELVIVNSWHCWTYVSPVYEELKAGGHKLNPENQYEPDSDKAHMFTSSTGNLEREIFFTTLGWLQSAGWQCLLMHLWACGHLRFYVDFWASPVYSILGLVLMTYWREIHFYFAHRSMHPWWDRTLGLMDGDVGAFLYRHVHSLHHKSYNPGPWSGLCMHPVEHLMYYSCATLPPLFFCVHPMHFLYCKFHADIAPVGGHDGMDAPGGKGDFHWLHHTKFECNYGVPFPINLDLMFGTWAEYDIYKETGELSVDDWAQAQMHRPEEEENASDKQMPLLDAESPATKASPNNGQAFDMSEVATHNNKADCWIALYGKVLNVTKFLDAHPGGVQVIVGMGGKDATSAFEEIHASSGGFTLVAKHAPEAEIGIVSNYSGPPPPEPEKGGGMFSKWPGAYFYFPVLAITTYFAVRA